MNEEITQCDIRIAEIGAECILTEEIVKSAACRMFTKESTALVAGAVELGISVFNINIYFRLERIFSLYY